MKRTGRGRVADGCCGVGRMVLSAGDDDGALGAPAAATRVTRRQPRAKQGLLGDLGYVW